jgi:hypothetical protein
VAERILVQDEGAPPPVVEPSPDLGLKLLCWLGGLLGTAGFIDVALLWVPMRFGRAEWEFGTVSAMFDALPLMTISVIILAAAAIARGTKWGLIAAGVGSAVITLVLLAALILWLLNAPLAWKGVNVEVRPVLKKSMVKTLMMAGIYLTLYSTTALYAWRTLRGAQSATPQGAEP